MGRRSSTRGTALPQIPNFQKTSDPAQPINNYRLSAPPQLKKGSGCDEAAPTGAQQHSSIAPVVPTQCPHTDGWIVTRAYPQPRSKVSSYLLPPGLPNSTGGALPAALPHSPVLSPPTQTTLICAFISPFRRRLGPPLDLNSPRPPEQCVSLPSSIRHALDFSCPLEPRMSRSQIGIDRLPARRMTSEPRESMNCKSCRKRKVVVRASNSNVVTDCVEIKCNRLRPTCEACRVFACPCIYGRNSPPAVMWV